MPKIYHNIKLNLDEELEDHLAWLAPSYVDYRILRQSVDARRRHSLQMVYSVEVFEQGEKPKHQLHHLEKINHNTEPVLIVGAGPAGLFAALRLLERGIPIILFEQGSMAEKRLMKINRFWRYGELDEKNNVGFGEGGAGLYSDGKLITRIKSPYIPYVMRRLVEFGAPEEIEYLSNPHVGSDKIRRLIPVMRKRLLDLGASIKYETKITEFLFDSSQQILGVKTDSGESFHSPHVILACGHSAEDIFSELHRNNVHLEGKSFAVGLRIEHPQELIDKIQFREFAGHEKLGAANYRLAYHDKKTDTGVYSFCMCPGGYVLSSGTKAGHLVSNGMSNYKRNSKFANSAIVLTVDYEKSFGNDLFGGLSYRNKLESAAFKMVQAAGGNKELPAQRLSDFLDGKDSKEIHKGSSPSGAIPSPLHNLFDKTAYESLRHALQRFEQNMQGFLTPQAQVYGVESRTSCPLRITRDPVSLQSISHTGLYPTGEGAGYAGGITSAACDGIKVAESIFESVKSQASRL